MCDAHRAVSNTSATNPDASQRIVINGAQVLPNAPMMTGAGMCLICFVCCCMCLCVCLWWWSISVVLALPMSVSCVADYSLMHEVLIALYTDGIALTPDCKWLYFCPLTSHVL